MLLGISASQRAWGNCDTAVKSVLLAAMKAGSPRAFLRLTDIPLEPCKGCLKCLVAGANCPVEDGLYELLGRIRSADGLVLAAPVYFMAPPAKLFMLLDRLLTVPGFMPEEDRHRRAATVTIMGNREWRGVAEPYVNLVVSLLGFDIQASVSLVAEGPGQLLEDKAALARLEAIGRAFAEGRKLEEREDRPGVCPVCRSDFFLIESSSVVCPVCGLKGDLAAYSEHRRFAPLGGEARWGTGWLRAHVGAWMRPSVGRYRASRREILSRLSEFKTRYASEEERGSADVH